jgi:nucleoside-diphosphate-sugar epimerase
VRRRISAGMPATIYRPSIVAGDSRTGETQKFDGPYFIMQLLLRQPRHAIMPMPGDPTMTRVNVVPRDFIVNAVEYLSGRSVSEGRTYQLADPRPLTVDELVDAIGRATGREPQGSVAAEAREGVGCAGSGALPVDALPCRSGRLPHPSDLLFDRPLSC